MHHILEFKATYRNAFHENMRSMVAANRGWDEIATSLITGTGAGNDPNANMLFWAKDAFQETQRQDYLDDQAAWSFVDKSHNDGTLNKLNTLRKGKHAGLRAS